MQSAFNTCLKGVNAVSSVSSVFSKCSEVVSLFTFEGRFCKHQNSEFINEEENHKWETCKPHGNSKDKLAEFLVPILISLISN